MKRLSVFILVTGYWLLVTIPVFASYITLNTTLSSKVENQTLKIKVKDHLGSGNLWLKLCRRYCPSYPAHIHFYRRPVY